MSLSLFPHNQSAYASVLELLEKTGKAAVIHPTGTGKSFIAFKLAEEHPLSTILWLSPSAYIFQTQVQGLQEVLGEKEGAGILSHIVFLTYSSLMIHENDIKNQKADYIILDEFHRCGAAEWGKSVQKLLEAFPKAKLLGLSATNIRYLDGQRDMAEEIFGGCIASEMTLGEAIAEGILPAPEYVVSMYSYQEEWNRLAARVKNAKYPRMEQENERLLDELRRTLEQADGLDVVFQRHMTVNGSNRQNGKYLVFCSGRAHMEEMAEQSKEWFHLVDPSPHIYQAVYDNPESSREFEQFKADNSSHLKLLFCIDMLNEGIHVEGIDGVILLRPTVSPILYLQQIGRSLTAGKKKGDRPPVIFDIVNNFEGLYSIFTLEKEMEDAFHFLPVKKGEQKMVCGRFQIYDEMKNCRELFEQLNRNLSAGWERYYEEAERYYQKHGNLSISSAYVAPCGLSVGTWLQTQRRVRQGKTAGKLTVEQIARLDKIGMEWESGSERKFRRGYQELQTYVRQYGNADVKASYITESGFLLGKWISNLRQNRNVTPEQKEELDKLGMIWNKRASQWERSYQAAKNYFDTYGNLQVPRDYRTEDGLTLGLWVANQRRIYAGKKPGAAPLSESCIQRLDKIGMSWG